MLNSTPSLGSIEDFEHTYSSINSLKTSEADNTPNEFPDNDKPNSDDYKNNPIYDICSIAENYCLGKAEAAHNAVLGKIDASLAKKTLRDTEAPRLNTKALITKLDEVAETVDFDVPTILAKRIKDPVLCTFRSWLRGVTSLSAKSPEYQQSKVLLRYTQELDQLSIEGEGQLLCYNEPSDKLKDKNLRVCLPLSLF